MSAWLTPETLAGLFATMVFVAVALQRPARAVLMYAVLGALPLQLGSFSGRTISQGLLPAEVLATVLLFAWLVKRRGNARIGAAAFEMPLLVFFAISMASLIGVVALPDYRIEHSVTLAVSVGQVLLVLWPIGVYYAAAEFLTDTSQLVTLRRIVIGLACLQVVVPFLPDAALRYAGAAWAFGLFGAPFACAAALDTRSLFARLFYVGVAVLPFIRGVEIGKAFLYFYVAAAVGTIVWVRASRLVAIGGGLVAAMALAGFVIFGERLFTDPMENLLNKEKKSYSYGGSSGRGALALDALSIWQEAPILGVGPGNSYIYMLQRAPIGTPHNQYLNILVEFGLFGLVGWIAFLVTAFRTGLRIYRSSTLPAHRTFVLGWLGMFAGLGVGGVTGDFMIHSIRNGGLELFSGYYLQWVFLGGIVAVHRLERRRASRPEAAEPAPAGPRRRLTGLPPRRPAAARAITS